MENVPVDGMEAPFPRRVCDPVSWPGVYILMPAASVVQFNSILLLNFNYFNLVN